LWLLLPPHNAGRSLQNELANSLVLARGNHLNGFSLPLEGFKSPLVVEGRHCGIMLSGVELEGLHVGEIAKPQLVLLKECVHWTVDVRKGN